MAAASASAFAGRNDGNKNRAKLPPRRGQIKAQIFESMVRSASSAASKAGALLGIARGSGAGSASDESPPPSAYCSDGNPDNLP